MQEGVRKRVSFWGAPRLLSSFNWFGKGFASGYGCLDYLALIYRIWFVLAQFRRSWLSLPPFANTWFSRVSFVCFLLLEASTR